MTRRGALGLVLLLNLAGCRWAAPPVQMYGTPEALERLAGQWSGQYLGNASHRRNGSIAFTLKPGTHDAQGDVLMVPEGGLPYQRYYPNDVTGAGATRTAADRYLSIRFIEVERGTVRGRLDQYWDPDRSSAATTEFVGRITDDVIEGTFTTTYRSGDPSTGGHWKVRRARR
jgi:hypothetical protein